MFDLVIKNARLVSAGDILEAEIAIVDGKIARIAKDIVAKHIIDAHGLLVLPGMVDAHVHFRDPGLTHKEDWYTGSSAAVAGGVTSVVDHPNTIPPTTSVDSFKVKLREAESKSIVDFGINAGVVQAAELEVLWASGITAFGEIYMADSMGGLSVDDDTLWSSLRIIKRLGGIACIHAEDEQIIRENIEKLGDRTDPSAHSSSRPNGCEVAAMAKAIRLAQDTGVKLHICHLSTREGLDLIGADITSEVTPHHLFLSQKDWDRLGTFGKMNPPLRSELDRENLWAGLHKIDIIASDHAPHTMEEKKQDIWRTPAGVPGVETSLPLMLSAVKKGIISLQRVIELMATNPARIFCLGEKGEIAVGKDADIVLVDLNDVTPIKARNLHSKSGWTPFEGLDGVFPKMTFVRGELMYDGEIVGEKGYGRFIPGKGANKPIYM
ncbi:MAG: dihydroorotase [Methanocellales archaeon]|nr:dihydroorotase [Methanocellales archaeon]MDD3292398.1 dihydroorotase [Methanocellales archaeon]MDD5235990.1 dihydroorotase [Methanocellales archaeon]MDD5485297.1 dihydroorotase [Methanocellales archaeon]